MTSEVALLNRSAATLAADSATTVTYWEKDHYETRYFKGTNKIFHLSDVHPVGLMIYAAASLQGAPWELLIKSYRRHLATRSHGEVAAYAEDFFSYVASNSRVFSSDTQEKQFRSDVDTVSSRILIDVVNSPEFAQAPDTAAKASVSVSKLAEVEEAIAKAAFLSTRLRMMLTLHSRSTVVS